MISKLLSVVEEVPELDRLYPELVRLAYLVLPATGPRKYRLALARRIAEESLPRRTAGRPERVVAHARTRALARAMRPGHRLRIGLGRWLADAPSPGSAAFPDPPAHLSALSPEVRVAYVMRRVEGRYAYAVHDQLVDLGVREAREVVRAAELLAPPPGPYPMPPVLRGPRLRSRVPVGAAVVLTGVLVGAIVVTENNEGRAHQRPPARSGAVLNEPGWPARGSLVADRAFTAAALAAWRGAVPAKVYPGAAPGPASAQTRVLFAGQVQGVGVALLKDGARLARYVRSGARPSLEVFPAYGDGSAPVVLADGRYLVPPEVASVRTAGLTAGTPAWRTVLVHGGVTDTVRPAPGSVGGCWSGPILSVPGHGAYADLAGPVLARWTGAVPAGLVCSVPNPAAPVAAASVGQFWTGRLPDGTKARWICTRYTYAGGGSDSHGALLEGGGVDPTGPCVTRAGTVASGLWWRMKGRWYHLTAAGPGLVPAASSAAFVTTGRAGGLFVGVGPKGRHKPATPVTIGTLG